MIRWILAARPKTLPAAVAPVLVGTAFAIRDDDAHWAPAMISLAFALTVQVATNFSNDYFDWVKGADTPDRIGPKRMVASGVIPPQTMRHAMILAFGAAFIIGTLLIPYGGWQLIPLGVICIACGVAYTGGPFPIAYRGLGELFVFIFFGIVAVCATYYVQVGYTTLDVLIGALAIGALATNILIVNNYRDIESDRAAGKFTLAVQYGRSVMLALYQAMILIALIVPVILWLVGNADAVLMTLALWPFTIFLRRGLLLARTSADFDRTLAGTAAFLIIYAVLFSAGIGLSGGD